VTSDLHDHERTANGGPISTSIAAETTSQLLTHETFPEAQIPWTHGHGRVESQPLPQVELPNTVPDSQPPKKMSCPNSGSLPGGDTQPVSPSIHASILTRSRTGHDTQQVSQVGQGTYLETQKTLHEGDEGHIDLLSALEEPELEKEDANRQDRASSEVNEPAATWDPSKFSPTQVESPEELRFHRPNTPASRGRKRNYRGDVIDSSTPINPLAGNGTPAVGAMALSQVFNATQAPSSPLSDNLTSDPLSNRPSPNFDTYGRAPPVACLSSPIKLPSSTRRPPGEPIAKYKSMQESQEERQRKLEQKRLLEAQDDSSDSEDSVFGPEDSIVLRQRRRRRMQEAREAARKQQSSPVRPRSRDRMRKRAVNSSSPRFPPHHDAGISSNATVIPGDEPSLDDLGNSSEEETDREEGLDNICPRQVPKVTVASEEEKENVDLKMIQVPMTTSRLRSAIGDDLHSDLSPSLRRERQRDGPGRRSDMVESQQPVPAFPSSPGIIIPNSQPSQSLPSSRTKAANGPLTSNDGNDDAPPNPDDVRGFQLSKTRVSFIPASSPSQSQLDAIRSASAIPREDVDHDGPAASEEINLSTPLSSKTDIIISIHPKHVADIVSGDKDHEFRHYLLPKCVRRMWIYETSPVSSIKYIADISHGKKPGEIANVKGLKNAEFNTLKGEVEYAYEIWKLYALERPVSIQDAKDRGWLRGPPQKYCYVKQPMIETLKGAKMLLIRDIHEAGQCQVVEAKTPSSLEENDAEAELNDGVRASSAAEAEAENVLQHEPENPNTDELPEQERQPGFGSSRLSIPQQFTYDYLEVGEGKSGETLDETASKVEDQTESKKPTESLTISDSRAMPPPLAPPMRQDLSTSSSHYDTARTQATGESDAEPAPMEHPSSQPSILASPSGKKRRALTEIAADPTPPNSFREDDFDIGDLMNVDEEFRAVVGSQTPSSPVRKRRRGNDGRAVMHGLPEIEDIQGAATSPLNPPHASPTHTWDKERDERGDHRAGNASSPEEDPITQRRRSSRSSRNVWDVSSHSPQRAVKPARRFQTYGKPTGKSTVRPPLRISPPVPQQRTTTEDVSATSTESPDPLQGNVSVHPQTLDTPEGPKDAMDRIAPNMVFALFNGRTRAYYPAVCLGAAASDQSRFHIKFEDTNLIELDSHVVRRLELRVGDSVKVNVDGMPKTPFAVGGFKDRLTSIPSLAAQSQQPRITDVFGNTTLLVVPRQRKSLPEAPSTAMEVPLSSVYLDTNLFGQLKDRLYTFTPTGDPSFPVMDPVSAPVSTPSTPSSRRGRFAASGIENAPTTGLFAGMVFAVSFGQDEDKKKRLSKLILANGGSIVSEGFNELFDTSQLGPISPAKRNTKTADALDDSTTDGFRLNPTAENLGFAALITDKHSRREKYLQALALNIPCLSGRWIDDCVSKSHMLPWDSYILPAGESKYLDGAIRSRVLSPYPPSTAVLFDIIASRPKLLEDHSVLIIMGRGRGEEKRKPYVFLTYALGARRVCRVPDLKAAGAKMEAEKWDWLYVDDYEEGAAMEMVEKKAGSGGGKKRKRGADKEKTDEEEYGKRTKVVVNETVVQSLILGRLYED
jgi:predicted transcriptional regulator